MQNFVTVEQKESRMSSYERNPKLQTFQHIVRGLRWMSANMLAWGDPNTIMPEQLDSKGLPKPPNLPPAIER